MKEVIVKLTSDHIKVKGGEYVQDLVRCKDCKYGDKGIDEDGTLFWKCLGVHYGGTSPDGFCNYGEVRDEFHR